MLTVKLALNLPMGTGDAKSQMAANLAGTPAAPRPCNPLCKVVVSDTEGYNIMSRKTRKLLDDTSPVWNEDMDLTPVLQTLGRITFQLFDCGTDNTSVLVGSAVLDASQVQQEGVVKHRLNLRPGRDNRDVSHSKLLVVTNRFQAFTEISNPLFNPEDIINLEMRELKAMFQQLDQDGNRRLSPEELTQYAHQFYEDNANKMTRDFNMSRADVDEKVLKGKSLATHIQELVDLCSAELDTDHDGVISQREFMLNWGGVSRKAFSKPDACNVM
jgi:Ca2+-dependent lipid-binding protein